MSPSDVRMIGADVLLCSAYKFCGPHLGIAFGRRELLEVVAALQGPGPPPMEPVGHRFETGTLPAYELLRAAACWPQFAYLDSLGGTAKIAAWERQLGERLLAGLPPDAPGSTGCRRWRAGFRRSWSTSPACRRPC